MYQDSAAGGLVERGFYLNLANPPHKTHKGDYIHLVNVFR